MNMDYIIYALMAVGFFTVYMSLLHLFRKDTQKERLKRTAADAFYENADEKGLSAGADFCHKMVLLTGCNTKNQKELKMQLLQAGNQSAEAVHYLLFFRRVIQPILALFGAYLLVKGLFSGDYHGARKMAIMLMAIIFLVFGVFGSHLYVTNGKQKRRKKILRSFPEGLDLLLVCIESGLGLDAALNRVCAELGRAHPEFAQELDRTRIELTVMSDRAQALQNLAERTQIVPIKALVASLIQTEKFGTSLVETLRVLSEDQRISRLMDAENRAAKIPVLITIPLIFCIMPAFMIVILGPPIVRVIEQGGIMGNTGKG